MQPKDLPEDFKGYSTAELLALWEAIKTPRGAQEDTPRAKVLAMRDLLREYKIAPVFQNPEDQQEGQ